MDSRNCRPPPPEPALEIRLPYVVAGILPGPRERPAPPGLLNADAAASMQDAVYIVFADMLTILLHCTWHFLAYRSEDFLKKFLRLPLLTKAKNMIIISLSKKSLWTFSPSCFQNCKIEFCSIILQFCRCGGLWNAKGHPDGFLSHYPSLRNFWLGSFFDSLNAPNFKRQTCEEEE